MKPFIHLFALISKSTYHIFCLEDMKSQKENQWYRLKNVPCENNWTSCLAVTDGICWYKQGDYEKCIEKKGKPKDSIKTIARGKGTQSFFFK